MVRVRVMVRVRIRVRVMANLSSAVAKFKAALLRTSQKPVSVSRFQDFKISRFQDFTFIEAGQCVQAHHGRLICTFKIPLLFQDLKNSRSCGKTSIF